MSFVGVLMLDTRFPRPVGDIGNPETFARLGIPVKYSTVEGASPQRVVLDADVALLRHFIAAARSLVEDGASLITTSCGFLTRFQDELQASVDVPVFTSSLLWLNELGADAAVLTIDATALSLQHLTAVGAATNTPIWGVASGCEFQQAILRNRSKLNVRQAQLDVVSAALKLVEKFPKTRTIVLECANMPPYAQAVAQATGLRVEHIMSLIENKWKL